MTEPDATAEILDDRTTSLAPPRSRAATGSLLDRRWRLAGIGAAAALAVAVIVLYSPDLGNVAAVPATPPASPVAVVIIPTTAPTPVPTPDEGPCRTDLVQVGPPRDRSVPSWYSPAVVPANALAAFVVEDDGNHGSVVVAGLEAIPYVAATYLTNDPARGGVSMSPIAWSSSGTTLLVRADQYGAGEVPGCSNLFLVNADGFSVTNLTHFGPGTSINDAALAPNSGLIAYSTFGEVQVIDPVAGEHRVATCNAAWQLRWSPDEQKFLGICNDVDVLVVDVTGRTAVQATLPDGLAFAAAIWSEDGTSITVVAATPGPTEGAPMLTVLDFSLATLTFEQRPSFSLPASLGFAAISPSGRWIVLQDTQDGIDTAVLDLATGVTTTLPKPPAAESHGGVPYAWESDGDTGLYAEGGVLYAVNLATATVTEVGKMPPSWFVWRNVPAP